MRLMVEMNRSPPGCSSPATAASSAGGLGDWGLDYIRHGERVDFVAGLHDLLFEIEEDLGEARLFLREGEDSFVDDLETERGTDAFTASVGDMEVDAGVVAGLVGGGVGTGLDGQFIGGLDEEQAMVGDGLGVAAEEVRVDVEGAGHIGRGVQGQVRLAIFEVEVAGEDGLAILDDVNISRAGAAGGNDLELDAVAGLDHGAAGAEQDLVGSVASLERDGGGDAVVVVVIGFDVEGLRAGARVEMNDGDAAGVGGG